MQAARQVVRRLAQRNMMTLKSVRGMAAKAGTEQAHLDEAKKEMHKWRTVTYAAVPTCLALAAYDMSHLHEHHEDTPDYPYLRIRSKEFPWGPNGLFERVHEDHESGEEEE